MSIQYDLHEIVNGSNSQTNFTSMLLRVVFKADRNNREKLRLGFPAEVEAVEDYLETGIPATEGGK